MTDVTLKEYFEQRLKDMDRRISGSIIERDTRIQVALTAAKEAVEKAEASNERRLALLNEFRAQQADESKKYVQREVFDQSMISIAEKIDKNETAIVGLMGVVQNQLGRTAFLAGFAAIFGGLIVGLVLKLVGGG